jgi:hypothetical protein
MSNIILLRQPTLLATATAITLLIPSSAAPAVEARPESAGQSHLSPALVDSATTSFSSTRSLAPRHPEDNAVWLAVQGQGPVILSRER